MPTDHENPSAGETREPAREDRPLSELKVAIVHDWLTGMRGGEKCLEVFCEIFPRAEIYTLFHFPGTISPVIEEHPIHVSFLNRLSKIRDHYRYLLPLFPGTVGRFKLAGYDLVLSSSHCVAKGARARGALHVCYCHTPMRYVWDRFDDYFGPGRPLLSRLLASLLRRPLQRWDVRTSRSVDLFIANSSHVAARIQKHYGRRAIVLHPPVDLERFGISPKVDDYYAIVSALAPYKRIDLAIDAFRRLGRRLFIIGSGPDRTRLERLAEGARNIEFLGWRADEEVTDLVARCRALLLPGEEDFGITPLEAMASGRPVIALGRGGALDTVIDLPGAPGHPPTGILFEEPSVDTLVHAVEKLERNLERFQPLRLREHAACFGRPRFRNEMERTVRQFLEERGRPAGSAP